MRLIIHILMVCGGIAISTFSVKAQDEDQNKSIKFPQTEIRLQELLHTIEAQTAIHFSFDPASVPVEMKINLPSDNLTLEKVLKLLNESYNIQFIEKNNVIILQSRKKKGQATNTVRGVIRDKDTGELLPGAEIKVQGKPEGTLSNQYGFYSLTWPAGEKATLQIRYMGYWPAAFEVDFDADTLVNVFLAPEAVLLSDVVVTADSMPAKDITSGIGSTTVTAAKIKETMSFAGEPDALKTLQFLPGVQSGNEGTTNLSVRGGSFSENLFLLDEAPVYNPSHALSFFSIFNPDALQSVTLYKNAIPVAYGGRLSSVVNVRTKEGNHSKRTYSGSIGTIASRLTAEGPLSKKYNNISYMVSGRYSYAGFVVNQIYNIGAYVFNDPTANTSVTDNKINFYDLNAKINYRKDDRNHFYFSVYAGHDDFYFARITSGYALAWGNKTATMRWNHVHSSKLFSNTTALYSNYDYQYRILNNTRYFLWNASFQEVDIKQDYDFYPAVNHHITFGGGVEMHWIKPGEVKPRDANAVTRRKSLQQQQPVGTYLYAGNAQSLNDNVRLHYGLRYSNFIVMGPSTQYIFKNGNERPYDSVSHSAGEVQKIFHRLDPRLALVLTRGRHTFTASYDRTTQYFHLLANSSVGFPTDIWMPSSNNIKPQSANIYALNYQNQITKTVEGSIGLFYKKTNHILDFIDNANLFVNPYVESQLLQGTSEAYGMEFFLQRTYGKFKGSVSYTLSKATNTIEGINGNRAFPSRYDKRHNVSATGKLTLSKRWEISLNYIYTTGGAITMPVENFSFDHISFNYYGDRNSFRMPDYHRCDFSVRFNPRRNDRWKYKSFWSFDIYNVYRRKNPFTIYSQQQDGYLEAPTSVSAVYMFGLVPSLSYSFTF